MKEFKNVKIEIFHDEHAENPRTFCERLTTIYSNYRDCDPDGHSIEELCSCGSLNWTILEREYIFLKIYGYSHSGITISTTPFNCPWDSGLFGVIAISKSDAKKEFGTLRSTTIKQIHDLMEAEVLELDNYLTGDTYGYRILDKSGNVIEEVCNYYGIDGCKEEAEHAAEYWDKEYDTKTAV